RGCSSPSAAASGRCNWRMRCAATRSSRAPPMNRIGLRRWFELLHERGTGRIQRVDQAVLRQVADDRFDDPAEPRWNVPRQGNGFALDPRPAVALLETP